MFSKQNSDKPIHQHTYSNKWSKKENWEEKPRRASMTTEEQAQIPDDGSKQLTDLILKGDHENAARVAVEIVTKSGSANDVVDTISDAMNIVSDLHEMERYSVGEVEKCEKIGRAHV